MQKEQVTHTPGPWGQAPYPNGTVVIYGGQDAMEIARVLDASEDFLNADNVTFEQAANARLIEAAPELLEAAKEAIHEMDMWFRSGELAASRALLRAAIAKATGAES